MIDDKVLWLYNNKYYDNLDDAIIAVIATNYGANLIDVLDIAEKEIIKVYEADFVALDKITKICYNICKSERNKHEI